MFPQGFLCVEQNTAHFCVHVGGWIDESALVRALMDLMHLCFIEGPLCPHNLISIQENPVPLLKFQLAPRLRLLTSCGSRKKGAHIGYV